MIKTNINDDKNLNFNTRIINLSDLSNIIDKKILLNQKLKQKKEIVQ